MNYSRSLSSLLQDDHSDREDDLRDNDSAVQSCFTTDCSQSESGLTEEDHSDRDIDAKDCDSRDSGADFNSSTHGTGIMDGLGCSVRGYSQILQDLSAKVSSDATGMSVIKKLPKTNHGYVFEEHQMQDRNDVQIASVNQKYSPHFNHGHTLSTSQSSKNNHQSQQQHLSKTQQILQKLSNGLPCTWPSRPSPKHTNPRSNLSTSRKPSNNNCKKLVKQAKSNCVNNPDPKRKMFFEDLFSFMHKRGTPIYRLPTLKNSVLDLYELYNSVVARGGLLKVMSNELWSEIVKDFNFPLNIADVAVTLTNNYIKYLYLYECARHKFSSPTDLVAIIAGIRIALLTSSGQLARPSSALAEHGDCQPTHQELMAQMGHILPHELDAQLLSKITHLDSLSKSIETHKASLFNSANTPSKDVVLNPSEAPPNVAAKRKREHSMPVAPVDREDQPPSAKKTIPTSFEVPDKSFQNDKDRVNSIPDSGSDYKCNDNANMSDTLAFSFSSSMESKGQKHVVLTLEVNGVYYRGVLFARSALPTRPSIISEPPHGEATVDQRTVCMNS